MELHRYLARERMLAEQSLTRNGGITYWILDDGSGRALASVETIRRPALLAVDGTLHGMVSHGCASVFTPAGNRGKGYAKTMLTSLRPRLQTHQEAEDKRVGFSVLYSDIGKEFYRKLGWLPDRSEHISLQPSHAKEGAARYLRPEEINGVCERDVACVRRRMAAHRGRAVAVLPAPSVLEWVHARSRFLMKEVLQKDITTWGAVVDGIAAVMWTLKPATRELYIARIAVFDDDKITANHLSALLRAAQAFAAELDFRSVIAWNPSALLLEAARQIDPAASTETRHDEGITSICYYVDGPTQWMENEYFAWC